MIGHLPRTILIGLAVLLWAALAAAWLVPPMLDWNRYRGEISALMSDRLGESLAISGQVRLVLLPQPLLVVDDVTLSDQQDAISLRTRELRLRVAFWPLLAGQVDAQELVLRGLDLRVGWPLGKLAGQLHPPPWLQAVAARVEDGTVAIGGAELHHLDASLGLVPDSGGIVLAGTTELGGLPWRLGGHLTQPGGDGASGFGLTLDGMGKADGLGASFSGQLAADGTLGGHLALHGPNLALLLPAPSQAFHAEAVLALNGHDMQARDIALDIAGAAAHGAASLHGNEPRHIDIALAANRLDLGAWLPFLLHGPQGGGAAARPGVTTNLDLSVEAATLAGGTLRQLRGDIGIDQDLITLRESSAILPGEARLSMSGKLRRASGGSDPHFEGSAALAAPSLRSTLSWLQSAGLVELAGLPDGVLRRADLRAALVADGGTPPLLALSDLNGLIDDSHVQGSVMLRPPANPAARLDVAAKLDLDRLNLDTLLPQGPLALVGLPARFGKLDFDVQLHAVEAHLGDRTLSPLSLDAALEPGKFTLRRLEAQLPGARLALAGSVAADGRIADGRLDGSVLPDAEAELLPLLPQALATHLPREKLSLTVQASGPPEALALRALADFGDLHAEIQPTLNLAQGSWRGTVALRHPGAPRLIESLGFNSPSPWLGSGSFSMAGTISGTGLSWPPQSLAGEGLDLAAGQLRAALALRLDLGEVPKLTGRIGAETLPLPLPAARAADPLPFEALLGWQASVKLEAGQVLIGLEPELRQFSTMLNLQNGTLKLDAIAAKLDDGALTGHATIAAGATPPNIQADLALAGAHPADPIFGLPIDLSGGVVDGAASLSASGHSPTTLLATLDGTLHLTQHDGSLIGVDLARMGPRLEDADLRVALADGSTAIDRAEIAATLHNGAAQFDPSFISGPAGRIDLSGLLDIVGQMLEMHLAITPAVPSPPPLGLRLSGNMASPTRTPELSDAPRWRAEHLPPPEPPVLPPAPKPPAKPQRP